MPVNTISDLSADEITKLEFRKGLRSSNNVELKNDTQYAVVILELGAAVTPDDYAALGTAIKAITGITDVELVIDHKTRASVPTDHTQVAHISTDIQLRDDTVI